MHIYFHEASSRSGKFSATQAALISRHAFPLRRTGARLRDHARGSGPHGRQIRLWPATLYGTLKRLCDAELIEESVERPAEELDDARRRYYRLTQLGRRVLAAESERL